MAIYACPSRRDPGPRLAPDDDEKASYSGGGWAWGQIDYAVNGQLIRNRPGTTHPLDNKPERRKDPRSGLARIANITDGASTTILTGEKAMDQARAGIEAVDASGRAVDMHSLRHGYISALAKTGVPIKTLQTLARHSDPKLTLNVSAHLSVFDTAAALEVLPDLTAPPPGSKPTGKLGSDGGSAW